MKRVPRVEDRRVQRTRAALRAALVALIEERGWDAIGVEDICERANVGRSTFYTHFADKEELLTSGFDDLRRMIVGTRPAVLPSGVVLGFSLPLLRHADESRKMFRALVGKQSAVVVQKRFRELVVGLAEEELGTNPGLVPVVRYVAGGFVELVTWWVDAPRPARPDALDALFQRLTTRVIGEARRSVRS